MDFQSVNEAALRFGVTDRAVQKWAKDGKILGAKKIGRSWLIPIDATAPDTTPTSDLKTENIKPQKRTPMPLLNGSFETGKCMEFINSIEDDDDRTVAMGEYYYFTGQCDKAVSTIEPYLDSSNEVLRYSASLICLFAALSASHTHLAIFALKSLQKLCEQGFLNKNDLPQTHSIGVFTATTAHVLLDIPIDESMPALDSCLRFLPGGIKMQACYVLAHNAYLEGKYVRALTIADMILALSPCEYPISSIYVHLVAAMALMKLKRPDDAKQRMQKAWDIAKKDGFIEPFVEHHGLLQGMIEVFFKKDYPHEYSRIVNGVNIFADGWRKIHNLYAEYEVTDKLTTTEFIVAMLYGHGWSVKEIASHMELSARTVTNYISTIYSKLYINDKKGLLKYILK